MKVVVLGSGFGGAGVASELQKRSKDLGITMIDRRARLEYPAAHPEILSGKVTPEEISGDLNKFTAKIGAEELSHSVNTLKGAVETKNALDKLDFSAKEIRIAVIGAGLTGVEVVGELIDYLRDKEASAKISIVEMMPRVLPTFSTENVSNYVAKFLSDGGIEILTETAVQEVSEHEK